ncbi:hypothetical protein DEU38_102436 [Rhodococcus sp. AG1013]|nr:hypothetical protein DEU38_102436 [Rhodococcus sp. AG1013]
MPSDEEITRIRRLISRIQADIDDLPAAERARIGESVAVVRRARNQVVGLGIPDPPASSRHPARQGCVTDGRSDNRGPPRGLRAATATSDQGTQRRGCGRDRDQRLCDRPCCRCRPHLPLPAQGPARPDPHGSDGAASDCRKPGTRDARLPESRPRRRPTVHHALGRAQQAAAAQTVRTARRTGMARSGLGAPTDIDQLQHRITMLEQHVVELTGLLEERDQELDAARAANRELFANMNRPGITR